MEPEFFRLLGKLEIVWDTASGVLQAAFLRKPTIELTLPVALGAPRPPHLPAH